MDGGRSAADRKGLFITLEGIDGTGKSTQFSLVVAYLKERGYPVLATREPGGTALGEKLRSLLLSPTHERMSVESEALLYAAARAQLSREVIGPALAAGRVVVCDRFADSTIAYQGYGGGLDLGFLYQLNRWAAGGLRPDLTLLLDIDPAKAFRGGRREDRIEERGRAYQEKVRQGYLALARAEPDRIVVVPAGGTREEVHERIRAAVRSALLGYGPEGSTDRPANYSRNGIPEGNGTP